MRLTQVSVEPRFIAHSSVGPHCPQTLMPWCHPGFLSGGPQISPSITFLSRFASPALACGNLPHMTRYRHTTAPTAPEATSVCNMHAPHDLVRCEWQALATTLEQTPLAMMPLSNTPLA